MRGLLTCIVFVGVGVLSLPAGTARAEAQSGVAVYPLAALRFQQLDPGQPADVRPMSVGSRAEIDVVGTGKSTITFTLPTALRSSSGHQVPLTFGANDGIWVIKGTSQQRYFDPRLPLELNIPQSRQGATLYLGGLAAPAAMQAVGEYSATITVQSFAPGT